MEHRVISPSREAISHLTPPLTAGEAKVLAALDVKLGERWEIYVQPHLNGCRPDFVLLNPSIGIGVIEVKDWDLEFPFYSWRTHRSGKQELVGERAGKTFAVANPLRRLLEYKNEIFEIYCPRLGQTQGFAAIGAGLVFPFASEKRVHELFGPQIKSRYEFVVGREAFENGAIDKLFPPSSLSVSKLMTADVADDLRSWLVEPDYSAEQREPLPFDAKQQSLVTDRTRSGYRRIRGPAGSGKSLVLAARAATLAAAGKRVLAVTFNITLIHYLRDLCARTRLRGCNDIVWINFHSLCRRLASELDINEVYSSAWRDHFEYGADAFVEIPKLLTRALDSRGQPYANPYDAILVDEGQDFHPAWWQLLRRLCKPDGELLLCADATQDVYDTSRMWTDEVMRGAGFSGPWSELPASYRLPKPLLEKAAEFAQLYLPSDSRQLPLSSQGELATEPCHLRWVQVDPEQNSAACFDELMRLITTDASATRAVTDLTLLVDKIQLGIEVVRTLNAKGVKTADTFVQKTECEKKGRDGEDRRKKMAFWKGRPRVKATTLHSFKGWEARLLVVNITSARSLRDHALIYAGLTRLKRHPSGSFLTVVCSDERLREFGQAWPDFEERVEDSKEP